MSKLKVAKENDLSKLDPVEAYIDRFVDLRLAYIKVLEKDILKGELHILEGLRLFKRACMWQPDQARQYLINMSGPNSPFKRLTSYIESGAQ